MIAIGKSTHTEGYTGQRGVSTFTTQHTITTIILLDNRSRLDERDGSFRDLHYDLVYGTLEILLGLVYT